MRVALAGATGLVGSLVVPLLAAAGHEVHALQRRAGGQGGRVHVAPPDQWPAIVRDLAPEAAISTLGTTMRKAGSEEGFAAVDHDLVLAFAAAAREGGARRMAAVSSVGADPGSRNFYLRIKGEAERDLEGLGFERLDLFRPGLLRGERGRDRRLGERLGILLSPLVNLALRGPLDRYAAIDSALVASAIVATLEKADSGSHVHHNREIRALAGRRA